MIWLLLLGLIIYLLVQRLTGITRTRIWLLWLVAMLPAFVLVVWAIANGGRPLPTSLAIGLFAGCLVLYLLLIQRGRIPPKTATDPTSTDDAVEPPPEIQPPEMPALRPLTKAEENELPKCFPWSAFYLQNIEYRPQAVVCRGQLRSQPDVAYQTVRDNVEQMFGDRFYVGLQESAGRKPFFVLSPNPHSSAEGKPPLQLRRPRIAIVLAIITLFTTTLAGLEIGGRILSNPLIFLDGLPYTAAMLGFFAMRALGHYLTAQKYKIAVTLPFFIPVIPLSLFPLGSLGAFSQIRSPIPDRRALFDVGAIGPMLGLCICIPVLAWGLTLSSVVGVSNTNGVFDYGTLDPRFSIVLAVFSKLALGQIVTSLTALKLHPIAAAGWFGLIFTAFNLMPIGQLDGGRIVHAMYGQRTGTLIGQCSKLLLVGFAIAHPYLRPWALLMLLLPAADEPALNDVTEVDRGRDALGLGMLILLLLVVLPVPKMLAKGLGM
jgi:membrane-associated protease RseP (regulator of RpoE activity)